MPKSNTIGCYKLGRTLGIGSFSKVKIGVHEPTSKRVAIKILNKRKLRGMEMEHKAFREIEILAKLNHPHVIRLYEVLDTPTDIFVVMEYVPRGELFDYIVGNGRLSESKARKFFQQLIAAVEYCHYKGVVHRDLKPENLLLDDDDNLRLADFGLSNVMEDGFFLSTSCGSPNYAAPEVICDELYAGPEVDVWSCGVILYALLCGCLPFDDEKIPNLFEKIKKAEYHRPPSLSSDATDLIEQLLTVDPLRRITINEIRLHPWFNVKIPRYLTIDPAASIEFTERKVNSKIVSHCSKLGFSSEEVEKGLKIGYRLRTTDRKYYKAKAYQRLREAAICYHLYFDKHYRAKFKRDADSAFRSSSSAVGSTTTTSSSTAVAMYSLRPRTGSTGSDIDSRSSRQRRASEILDGASGSDSDKRDDPSSSDRSKSKGRSSSKDEVLVADLSSLDVRPPSMQRREHEKQFKREMMRATIETGSSAGSVELADSTDDLAERYRSSESPMTELDRRPLMLQRQTSTDTTKPIHRTYEWSEYNVTWKVGMVSHDPYTFLCLLFDSLKQMHFEWILESTYCIIARTKRTAHLVDIWKQRYKALRMRDKERRLRIRELRQLKLSCEDDLFDFGNHPRHAVLLNTQANVGRVTPPMTSSSDDDESDDDMEDDEEGAMGAMLGASVVRGGRDSSVDPGYVDTDGTAADLDSAVDSVGEVGLHSVSDLSATSEGDAILSPIGRRNFEEDYLIASDRARSKKMMSESGGSSGMKGGSSSKHHRRRLVKKHKRSIHSKSDIGRVTAATASSDSDGDYYDSHHHSHRTKGHHSSHHSSGTGTAPGSIPLPPMSLPIEVKLQLYLSSKVQPSVADKADPRSGVRRKGSDPPEIKVYVLDIQRLKGESVPFLEFCTRLMGQMKYIPH